MAKIQPKPLERPLYEVTREIIRDHQLQGKGLYFGAVPYVEAMKSLDKLEDHFFEDSGRDIVIYALSNLATWRGETARRVKAELNAALAVKR